jgi:uncharacterized protein
MSQDLPTFRYHPDPIATGSVEPSETVCIVCGRARRYVYTGVPSCEDDVEEGVICPWCIADGSAHARFDAEFTDTFGIGYGFGWDDVSQDIKEEIAYRTLGFCGWQ